MTINDIKNMSDEEFINYVQNFKKIEDKEITEYDVKMTKKVLNCGSVFSGILFGLLSSTIIDNFTDDKITLGITFIIGSIIGIPVYRKLINSLNNKCLEFVADVEKDDLIEIKKDIENLTSEQLLFLKGIDNNDDMLELHDKITNIIEIKNKDRFFNDLEVTYEDDEKDLGYSKNIIKNN